MELTAGAQLLNRWIYGTFKGKKIGILLLTAGVLIGLIGVGGGFSSEKSPFGKVDPLLDGDGFNNLAPLPPLLQFQTGQFNPLLSRLL
ncbi:MAG: hypothetical protein ABGW77_01910 [Campylobacterales bacterium]